MLVIIHYQLTTVFIITLFYFAQACNSSTVLSLVAVYDSLVLYSSFVLVVGSDNLTASNNVERIFFICMLIIGAIIYALIVSACEAYTAWGM